MGEEAEVIWAIYLYYLGGLFVFCITALADIDYPRSLLISLTWPLAVLHIAFAKLGKRMDVNR